MPRFRQLLGTTLRTLIDRTRKPHTDPFTATMTIDQAWHATTGAPEVFARHHLPACDGCSVRFDETISEASAAYGIDLDAFLTQLNNTRL